MKLYIEEMPNFWAVRIREPREFLEHTFRNVTLSKRYRLSAIMGWMKADPGRMRIQSYRFKKDVWRIEDVQRWIAEKMRAGSLGEYEGRSVETKLKQAIQRARQINKEKGINVYVVYDPCYDPATRFYPYALSGDTDLETFFADCEVVYTADYYTR